MRLRLGGGLGTRLRLCGGLGTRLRLCGGLGTRLRLCGGLGTRLRLCGGLGTRLRLGNEHSVKPYNMKTEYFTTIKLPYMGKVRILVNVSNSCFSLLSYSCVSTQVTERARKVRWERGSVVLV